jgi:hypothetical protein
MEFFGMVVSSFEWDRVPARLPEGNHHCMK